MTTSFSVSSIIVIILVAICLAVPFTLAGRKNKSSEGSKEKTEDYIRRDIQYKNYGAVAEKYIGVVSFT